MNFETGLVILLLVGVTLPLAIAIVRARPASDRIPIFAAWAVVVAAVAWLAATYAPPERTRNPPTDRPLELAPEIERAAHDRHVRRMLEVRLANDPRTPVR